MTEDEAKTKWCPFARVASIITDIEPPVPICGNRASIESAVVSSSGEPMNPPSARCIASACMVWRVMGKQLQDVGKDAYEVSVGYCGLAGDPRPTLYQMNDGGRIVAIR